jgi:tape measure domain-containing protein
MATLSAVFRLTDRYTRPLAAMDNATRSFGQSANNAANNVDEFNNNLNDQSGVDAFMKKIGKIGATIGGLAAIKKGMDLSDEVVNTTSRLNFMNDGLQTTQEMQEKIYQAAERSRGSYLGMQQAVAKLGQMAGEAFTSNDEIIGFTELLNKSFKIGGAGAQEQAGAMLQLTQAMASGRLQGDEFTSISENAPLIAQALTKYLGISKAELKKLSSEGVISSDIIKAAMFDMAEEINTKFADMPRTFGDVMTSMKNNALLAFQPMSDKFQELINSPAFDALATAVIAVIGLISAAIVGLMDLIMGLGELITEWWFIIEPMLIAAATVIIPLLIMQIYAMAAAAWAAVVPWLIAHIPILILIAVIGLLIFILIQCGVTTEEIVGFIVGTFYMLVAAVYNDVAVMYNLFAIFAEFLYNVFVDPIAACKKLFYELGMYVMKIFRWIAKQIQDLLNAIPKFAKVDLVSGLDSTMSGIQDHIDTLSNESGLKTIKRMEMKDFGESFNNGYNAGSGFMEKLGGMSMPEIPAMDMGAIGNVDAAPDFSNLLGDKGKAPKATPVKNDKAAGKLNVSVDKEDIKYLKDIAERDYMVKYTTATLAPQMQVTFGDVRETADVNKMMTTMQKMLEEQIAVVSEGVS